MTTPRAVCLSHLREMGQQWCCLALIKGRTKAICLSLVLLAADEYLPVSIFTCFNIYLFQYLPVSIFTYVGIAADKYLPMQEVNRYSFLEMMDILSSQYFIPFIS